MNVTLNTMNNELSDLIAIKLSILDINSNPSINEIYVYSALSTAPDINETTNDKNPNLFISL